MADRTSPHIGYWHEGVWQPWCEVYHDWMPDDRPLPPSDEVCADCFALAAGELTEALVAEP